MHPAAGKLAGAARIRSQDGSCCAWHAPNTPAPAVGLTLHVERDPLADEVLHLVLETLTAAAKAAPDAAAHWEQQMAGGCSAGALHVSSLLGAADLSKAGLVWCGQGFRLCRVPAPTLPNGGITCSTRGPSLLAEPALNAWIANVADPLLSVDARELLEALAAIPACLPNLQVSALGCGWLGGTPCVPVPVCRALLRAAPCLQGTSTAPPLPCFLLRRPACCPRCVAS